MKSQIEISNLNVHFGRNNVLKNVSLVIPEKKLTTIIGPSGCGKSTLLRCLNRLTEADGARVNGKILVDGLDIFRNKNGLTALRKKIGLLSQKPYPLPMCIYDNVAYGPRIHGIKDRVNLNRIVKKHLELVGLWDEVKDRLGEPASRLSIGQQQRLCLARGLAVEPEIILCDEPTSALDPISAKKIEDLLVQLSKDYTIVLVTHILRQAKRVANYVIFLYLGEVIEQGAAKQVFERPKNRKTQEYISSGYVN